AWLEEEDDPVIARVNQRIEDITGLEVDTAELLQGTAVFWYNLFKSGEGDYRTRHAACPVLVGSKWVSNKWIHERGQEFRRPCGLTEVDRS
ncbi:hypothetical protein KUCAC02_003011, partial [Chaenocephalus aceratus]